MPQKEQRARGGKQNEPGLLTGGEQANVVRGDDLEGRPTLTLGAFRQDS